MLPWVCSFTGVFGSVEGAGTSKEFLPLEGARAKLWGSTGQSNPPSLCAECFGEREKQGDDCIPVNRLLF